MSVRRGTLIFTKEAIRKRSRFKLAEAYCYPVIGMYIKHKTKEKGISIKFFMEDFNKRYNTKFSAKLVWNLINGYHIGVMHFGHINMFTSYFDTTIKDFCEFYAKNAEK